MKMQNALEACKNTIINAGILLPIKGAAGFLAGWGGAKLFYAVHAVPCGAIIAAAVITTVLFKTAAEAIVITAAGKKPAPSLKLAKELIVLCGSLAISAAAAVALFSLGIIGPAVFGVSIGAIGLIGLWSFFDTAASHLYGPA